MVCDRMIAAGITLLVVDLDVNPPGSSPADGGRMNRAGLWQL
jgi:hypothetical protein